MVRSSPRFLGIKKKVYNRFQDLSRPWTPEELARDKKRVLRNRNKKRAKRQKEEKEKREKAVEEAERFLDEQSKLYEKMICCNNKEFSSSLDRISSILIRQGAEKITRREILDRLVSVDDWKDPKFILTSIMEFLKSIKKFHSTYEQYCHGGDGESFEDPFGVTYRDPPQTRREFLQDNGLPMNEGVVRNLEKNVRETNPGNKQIDPATLKALKKKRDNLYIMSQCLSVALSSLVKGELYDVAMA